MKFIVFALLLSSCSGISLSNWNSNSEKNNQLDSYEEFTQLDYSEHVTAFEDQYIEHNKRLLIQTSYKSKKYLEKVVNNIIKNNELFFEGEVNPTFYIVKSNIPFHFSLPKMIFFISSTMLERYVKNESMLYSLITYELIRSEKRLYRKNLIIPTGVMSTSRILSLLRLNVQTKVEIHKWAYYLLNRVGVEPTNYLSWLQVKNRNSADFILQFGDIKSISREESLFKAFLIRNKITKRAIKHRGSTKRFYAFLNNIKS